MPFQSGETVRLHHTSDTPDDVVLEFLGQRYTTANGLELKRKGRLVAEVRLPRERGKYPYTWTDGEAMSKGHLRVQGGTQPKRVEVSMQGETPFDGVRVRRA